MDSAFNYRLWQRLKESFPDSDTVWYRNAPVGEKKLGTFLSCLSKATNYTNHSIRATGTSVLSKCMYGPSQVMSVTGPCSALVFTYEIATQKKFIWESLFGRILFNILGLKNFSLNKRKRANLRKLSL